MPVIEITDFQSIAQATIQVRGLTVVTGPSNAGKSAVVRAIAALVTNPRSKGSGNVREGASSFRVRLSVPNGAVSYTRTTKGAPAYQVVVDGVQTEHTAMGASGAPPSVGTLAGVIDPELQVVDQFAPPYLVSESAGTVARTLGALTSADRLIQAVSHAGKRGLDKKAEAATLTRQAQEWGGVVERLDTGIASVQGTVTALTPQVQAHTAKRASVLQAASLIPQAQASTRALQTAQAVSEAASRAAQVGAGIQGLTAQATTITTLRSLLAQARAAQGDVVNFRGRHAAFVAQRDKLGAQLDEVLMAQPSCPVCGGELPDDAAEHLFRHE